MLLCNPECKHPHVPFNKLFPKTETCVCVFLYSFGRAKVFGAHYLDLITDMIRELSPKHPTETEENLILVVEKVNASLGTNCIL